MRKLLLLLVASLCFVATDALAQYVQVVAIADNVAPGKFKSTKLNCPAGYIPIAFGWGPKHAGNVVFGGSGTIDNTGKVVDVTDLADGSSMIGGGYQITVQSQSTVAEDYMVQVICQKITGTVTYVKQTAMVAPGTTGNLTGFCASGYATGTLTNIGQNLMYDMGDAPVWGSPTAPSYLGNLTVPTMPPAAGWEATATNKGTAARPLTQIIICQMLPPGSMTFIYSKAITQGMRYALPLPLPDGYWAMALGFDGYPYNAPYGRLDTWHQSWRVPSEEFAGTQTGYWGSGAPQTIESAPIQLYRWGGDLRAPPPPYSYEEKAGNTVVGAVLAIPTGIAPPAATVATIVEFYNQALDHYFITAAAGEISDLDNGVHKGWARTGQSFHSYAAGSAGRPGRQPVCRAYGNPAVGLDSHFYSAAVGECFDTLAKFAGAWLLEASEVFQMDLPDTTTGACPAGDVPVYRLFNNRADANHRYTTSTVIRDQMVGKGYIAEGYGPNNVTLCALP
jgi:hypothetical protein